MQPLRFFPRLNANPLGKLRNVDCLPFPNARFALTYLARGALPSAPGLQDARNARPFFVRALQVIPGGRKAGPGIQMPTLNLLLDSGFASFARAPE